MTPSPVSGWQKIETFNNGQITAWTKNDVPPAHRIESDAMPAPWEGLLWGTLPIGSSFLAILLVFILPEGGRIYEQDTVPIGAEQGTAA